MPPTPERAEGAPHAPRASRLPRFKLPFVELPARPLPSPGVHYRACCGRGNRSKRQLGLQAALCEAAKRRRPAPGMRRIVWQLSRR